MESAQQTKIETRQTSVILPLDVDEAVKRFQLEDMRPTFNNALVALVVAGLEANRRRRPLRPVNGTPETQA